MLLVVNGGNGMIHEGGALSMVAADGKGVLPGSSMSESSFDTPAEIQEGAESFRRALLTRLLVNGSEQTRVVLDRRELGRLFERHGDAIAWEAFLPRLRVCDLLEDAVEYLEAEMAVTDARPVGESSGSPYTCWFTTPGADLDVVLQTLQGTPSRRFLGLLFGPRPHVSAVYAIEDTTRPRGFGFSPELLSGTPAMTEEEALRALTSCRI